MKAIVFYFSLPFIYLLSLLPFPLLYLLSDFVFVLLYYGLRYRRKVIYNNLRNSFPEKSEEEIKMIEKKTYRYMCDLFLEMFKTLTISKKNMLRHCYINKPSLELFQKYYNEKKGIALVLGHQGNWEWAGNAFGLQCKHQLYVIYHPIANPYFNRFISNMRMRFGSKLIDMKNTYRDMVTHKNQLTATAFIADQTPSNHIAYWTTFMHQDTPVFWGTENVTKKMNLPLIFIAINKIKRGYYEINAETICENSAQTAKGEISELHTRKLETEIRKYPETWLWSHKRWKHKRIL